MRTTLAVPLLDLFGEEVILQRRAFGRRPVRKPAPAQQELVQLGFLDILEMSDEALERLRVHDEITEEYVEWLREYLLKLTLRQLVHPQVSELHRREAVEWVMSDDMHPFSFKVCCAALQADHEDVREGVLAIMRKHAS